VEAFHLVFLRASEAKLDRSRYVVKGGVNLRAWFGSQRYSEDMDLDVLNGEVFDWRDRVDAMLRAPAFVKLLQSQGLSISRASKPKQTETTQRWKFGLRQAGSEVELHTKIELSRRGSQDEFVLEPVLSEVVRPCGIPAPAANHYTASSAIWQKIAALAGRRETQARDVWDLDHVFRTIRSEIGPLPSRLVAPLAVAVDRVLDMPFEIFRGQVVPYLTPEAQELSGTAGGRRRIQEHVFERLAELQK